jgi:DNA polymerase I-like protein with 3'-5' exonuclease and polymerase domains
MVIAEDLFIENNLIPANYWYIRPDLEWLAVQVLWVHDELQVDTVPDYTELVGELLIKAAALAGQAFELRVPVDAEYKVGPTWKDTH